MMTSRSLRPARAFAAAAGLAAVLFLAAPPPALAEGDAVARGAYLFAAAGCKGCHTRKKDAQGREGPFLAGGRALKTPFGTFYSPNITPDPETGIGAWSENDFIRALRDGRSPTGQHYFPAFPYPSYTGMTDADMRDLYTYIRTVPPVRQANRAHELDFPFSLRALVGAWKVLYFDPGPRSDRDRGAYLAETLGHCGACHTPRTGLGGPDTTLHFAGTKNGPEGAVMPNITPHRETGIGTWTEGDLLTFFSIGMLPDGDFAGSTMGEVITNTTSKLTKADRAALAAYLRALPPIENRVRAKKAPAANAW